MNTYAILSKKAQEVVDELISTEKYQEMLASEILSQKLAHFDADVVLKEAVRAKIAEVLSNDYLPLYQVVDEDGEPMFEDQMLDGDVVVKVPVIDTDALNAEIQHILSDAELMTPVLTETVVLTDAELKVINGKIITAAVEEQYNFDLGSDEEKQQESVDKLMQAVEQVVKDHMDSIEKHPATEEIESDIDNNPDMSGDADWGSNDLTSDDDDI